MEFKYEAPASPFETNLRRAVGRTAFGFGVLFVVYIVSSLVIDVAVTLLFPQWLEQDWYTLLMSVLPLYGIAFPLFYVIIRDVPASAPPQHRLAPQHFALFLPMSIGLMIGGSMITNAVVSVLSRFFPYMDTTDPVSEALMGEELIITAILAGIVAPIMEELICRKLILDRIRPLGEGISIILSGFLFGALHGNLHQFFYAALLGMLLAFVYLKTGKIVYPMLLHMLVNIICGVLPTIFSNRLMPFMEEEEFILNSTSVLAIWDMLNFVMAEYALAIIGAVLLYFYFREMKFHIAPSPFEKKKQFQIAFLNVGIAIVLVAFLGLSSLYLFVE